MELATFAIIVGVIAIILACCLICVCLILIKTYKKQEKSRKDSMNLRVDTTTFRDDQLEHMHGPGLEMQHVKNNKSRSHLVGGEINDELELAEEDNDLNPATEHHVERDSMYVAGNRVVTRTATPSMGDAHAGDGLRGAVTGGLRRGGTRKHVNDESNDEQDDEIMKLALNKSLEHLDENEKKKTKKKNKNGNAIENTPNGMIAESDDTDNDSEILFKSNTNHPMNTNDGVQQAGERGRISIMSEGL